MVVKPERGWHGKNGTGGKKKKKNGTGGIRQHGFHQEDRLWGGGRGGLQARAGRQGRQLAASV